MAKKSPTNNTNTSDINAIAPVDVSDITTASLSLLDKLRAVVSISSEAEYNFIISIGREAQKYLKLADEKLNPNIQRWKDGLDAAKSEKEGIISPFKEAKALAKSLGEDWIKREKARKLQEDRALLEKVAQTIQHIGDYAVNDLSQIERKIELPLPTTLLPPITTTKTPGSSVRTYPKFRILDPALIHRDFCKPDEQLIRQLFNSLDDPHEIETLVGAPGAIEYYEDETLSFRG